MESSTGCNCSGSICNCAERTSATGNSAIVRAGAGRVIARCAHLLMLCEDNLTQ